MDEDGKQSRGMTLTLSDWFYEGLLMDGGLLSIDPVYFSITGGRERWLYRVARKHAGGAGEEGFAIPLPTLFEKSGAEGTYRRFKFEMLAIVRRNDIPGFHLILETGRGEPVLRMVRAEFADGEDAAKPASRKPRERCPAFLECDARAAAALRPAGAFGDHHQPHPPRFPRLGHLCAPGRVRRLAERGSRTEPRKTTRRPSTVSSASTMPAIAGEPRETAGLQRSQCAESGA